jgi:hypothetical protein
VKNITGSGRVESKGEGSKFLPNRYEGEWENVERCCAGVFYYANGAKYIGEWYTTILSWGRLYF